MHNIIDHEAFPLEWPTSRPRTAPGARRHSQFRTSPGLCRDDLILEVERFGGRRLVISTNMPLRQDGLPMTSRRAPEDPGVCVYFTRRGKPVCMPCDLYRYVHDNMRAIHKVLQAMRAIERHGGGHMLELAFSGFAVLPAAITPVKPWWDVLGLSNPYARHGAVNLPTHAEVSDAFLAKSKSAHPDKGGSEQLMAEITRARTEALEALSLGAE